MEKETLDLHALKSAVRDPDPLVPCLLSGCTPQIVPKGVQKIHQLATQVGPHSSQGAWLTMWGEF